MIRSGPGIRLLSVAGSLGTRVPVLVES